MPDSFGGRQALGGSYADFVSSFGCLTRKSAKAPRYPPSKASGERTADLETKPAVVPTIQIRIRGNKNTCRHLKSIVIRKIWAVSAIEF